MLGSCAGYPSIISSTTVGSQTPIGISVSRGAATAISSTINTGWLFMCSNCSGLQAHLSPVAGTRPCMSRLRKNWFSSLPSSFNLEIFFLFSYPHAINTRSYLHRLPKKLDSPRVRIDQSPPDASYHLSIPLGTDRTEPRQGKDSLVPIAKWSMAIQGG